MVVISSRQLLLCRSSPAQNSGSFSLRVGHSTIGVVLNNGSRVRKFSGVDNRCDASVSYQIAIRGLVNFGVENYCILAR